MDIIGIVLVLSWSFFIALSWLSFTWSLVHDDYINAVIASAGIIAFTTGLLLEVFT